MDLNLFGGCNKNIMVECECVKIKIIHSTHSLPNKLTINAIEKVQLIINACTHRKN
jgi:hypothetical protein